MTWLLPWLEIYSVQKAIEVKNKMANLSHSPEATVVKKKIPFLFFQRFLMQDKHIFKLFFKKHTQIIFYVLLCNLLF